MKRTLVRIATTICVCGPLCFVLVGCGSSTPSTPTASVDQVSTTRQGVADATVPATDVVSQFLDRVRRGGEDSGVGDLLTVQAQSELERIGQTVQPIGSPDASFEVTRGEQVPDDENAMLVHSVWREPSDDGGQIESQVVWALRKESDGWRISGLAMEFEPGQEPLVINFEDGNRMQQILGGEEVSPTGDAGVSQAALPSENESR